MKLHYMGKYQENPEELPHPEHKPGAVKFDEPETPEKFVTVVGAIYLTLFLIFDGTALLFHWSPIIHHPIQTLLEIIASFICAYPHEFLHAICCKGDVYLYTMLSKGMLFVLPLEDMTKTRFIFMSLLPNIIFGFIPYIIGMVNPKIVFLLVLGALSIPAGSGDYLNVYNAFNQMPKGARTYIYGFNSYWYLPDRSKEI